MDVKRDTDIGHGRRGSPGDRKVQAVTQRTQPDCLAKNIAETAGGNADFTRRQVGERDGRIATTIGCR